MRPALPLLALLLLLAGRGGCGPRLLPPVPPSPTSASRLPAVRGYELQHEPAPGQSGRGAASYRGPALRGQHAARAARDIQGGEIPPKPDQRTLTEKLDGITRGMDNRMCCNIDACSITDYKACMSQREADRLALLKGAGSSRTLRPSKARWRNCATSSEPRLRSTLGVQWSSAGDAAFICLMNAIGG